MPHATTESALNSLMAWESSLRTAKKRRREIMLLIEARQPIAAWEIDSILHLSRLTRNSTVSAVCSNLLHEGLISIVGFNKTPAQCRASLFAITGSKFHQEFEAALRQYEAEMAKGAGAE